MGKPKSITFVVPGPLMPYHQTTKKSILHPKERARSKAYGQWKEDVRILAYKAGLTISGIADREKPPRLSVNISWETHARCDFKNIYGSLEDAIWYENDRYVKPGKHSDVTWDTGIEQAVVTVELGD